LQGDVIGKISPLERYPLVIWYVLAIEGDQLNILKLYKQRRPEFFSAKIAFLKGIYCGIQRGIIVDTAITQLLVNGLDRIPDSRFAS